MPARGSLEHSRLHEVRVVRQHLGEGETADMHGDNLVAAPLDLLRFVCAVPWREHASAIFCMPLRPVDDGAAALDDSVAFKEDRESARLGAAAFRQDLVETRGPADLAIGNAMPIECPPRLLAIRRDAERYELYFGFSHVILPWLRRRLSGFALSLSVLGRVAEISPDFGSDRVKHARVRREPSGQERALHAREDLQRDVAWRLVTDRERTRC